MSKRKRNYRNLNGIVDGVYDLRSTIERDLEYEDISIAGIIVGIAAVVGGIGCLVGATAGLGLSFTALSPLVIGGIIGAIFPALLALVAIGARYYFRNEINELKKEASPVEKYVMEGLEAVGAHNYFPNEINKSKMRVGLVEKRVIAALMAFFIPMTIISTATGVGLAAATNAVFPGIFATWWAIVVGAGIGAITLLAGITTVAIIAEKFAGNLFEYVIPDQYVI